MSQISEILTNKPETIWSVTSEHSVYDAIKMMSKQGIGAVLVIEDELIVGILSERDCARKVVLECRSAKETRVGEIMTRNVFTTTRDKSISECMSMMTDNHFRHLPIVEDSKVVGMISIGDLVRAMISEYKYTIEQLEQYIAG
ncbi:MAG: CBS domain-containing protein [Gammaproteobacteria bacterium]|nr:CBS domain-containing protein [Gammaproteobacteria bacterium]MCY4217986.1 CBS domain-containing protein [Gammaproteobacteria bacterium]